VKTRPDESVPVGRSDTLRPAGKGVSCPIQPTASIAFSEQVKRAARLIANHPRVGIAVAPVEGIRRFVSAPYHLDYVIETDRILIVSIMHARQGPADLEKDEDDDFE
jgi:plasmid stabilization system protein ParE